MFGAQHPAVPQVEQLPHVSKCGGAASTCAPEMTICHQADVSLDRGAGLAAAAAGSAAPARGPPHTGAARTKHGPHLALGDPPRSACRRQVATQRPVQHGKEDRRHDQQRRRQRPGRSHAVGDQPQDRGARDRGRQLGAHVSGRQLRPAGRRAEGFACVAEWKGSIRGSGQYEPARRTCRRSRAAPSWPASQSSCLHPSNKRLLLRRLTPASAGAGLTHVAIGEPRPPGRRHKGLAVMTQWGRA